MSGGNCPETPRQKMIGMMYLMLTAMLALNVSGDLLNAFILVDKSIKESTVTVEGKNRMLYGTFDQRYAENQKKVGEKYEIAQQVKQRADSLYELIKSYKELMVFTADGPEFTPDNYLSTSNQDIAAQLMIVEQNGARGRNLRDKIVEYREFLKSVVDTTVANNVDVMLKADDPPMHDGVQVTWQSQNFEHIPLAASMSLLSKMQNDVRNTEADVISHLLSSIDAASFKFNTITPLVIPESNYVLRGGQYKADIMLAAYDDTQDPTVVVEGNKLEVEAGRGKYTASASSIGTKKYSARIQLPDPLTGEMKSYDVEAEYEVGEPSVVVSPAKMNVVYLGLDNPLEISAAGISGSDLKISADGCTLTKSGSQYICKPKQGSQKVVIRVSADVNGKVQSLGTKEFRVMRTPDPVPQFAGANSGPIKKSLIDAQAGVFAKMKDFAFDVQYKVTRFTLSTVKGGFLQSVESRSASLSGEQKTMLKSLNRGAKFYIEGIEVEGPDGKRKLGGMSFTVD